MVDAVCCSLRKYLSICETEEFVIPDEWTEYICQDKRLSSSDKLAWLVLLRYAVKSKDTKVRMSVKRLGEKVGKNRSTSTRILKSLKKFGYITATVENILPYGVQCTCIEVGFPENVVDGVLMG